MCLGEAGMQQEQGLHSSYLLKDEAEAVCCPQYPFPTPLAWKQNSIDFQLVQGLQNKGCISQHSWQPGVAVCINAAQ